MPTLRVPGGELAYEVAGEGDPLCFLHCWMGNRRFWREQVRHFSDSYQCVLVDFRGHGQSRLSGLGYSPALFAKDVWALLERLGLEDSRMFLVGHSLGGMVAMRLALDHPEIARGLALLNSSACLRDYLFQGVSSFLTLPLLRLNLVMPMMKKFVLDAVVVGPQGTPELRQFIEQAVMSFPDEVAYPCLLEIRNFDVRSEIHRLRVPTLIVAGFLDVLTDVRHARALKRRLPRAELKILPRASHMAMLEQPDLVNGLLEKFFEKCKDREEAAHAVSSRRGNGRSGAGR